MARKYAQLWARLAKNETVVITCPKRGKPVVAQGIYNEKYRHQVARKATDLPGYGRVQITEEPVPGKPNLVKLTVCILFSGDNL